MFRLLRVTLLLILTSPLAHAAELPYLYERLNKNPVYKASLDSILRGKPLTPWLQRYMTNRDGVDTPGKLISVAGKPYELYNVCQPHNCVGNLFLVMYEVGGEKAVVLLTIEGNELRFFGNPSQPQRDALLAAAR